MRSSRPLPSMHELSVCQSLLSQIEHIVDENGAIGVHSVRVQVGPLSGVDAQLLAQAFPIAVAGTIADGAELIMETIAITVKCQNCGEESEVRANQLICRSCGDWHTTLLSGDELILASVELNK